MLELAVFFAALAPLCWRDIAAMRREGLRRELIPYLALTAVAAALALLYLVTPDRRGIIPIILRALKIQQ